MNDDYFSILKTVDLDEVDSALNYRGYYLVKNSEFIDLVIKARAEYLDAFAVCELHPAAAKFTYEELSELGFYRKSAIGGTNGLNQSYAQLLTTLYSFTDSHKTSAINTMFLEIIGLRNALMRVVEPDFGMDPVRDKFWNASRIHHYPVGGGFMVGHCDTYFPMELGDRPYYQLGVLMSQKGRDFTTGGGFVVDKSTGEKCDIELEGGLGTVVVFDGRTIHGVDDVDKHRLLDLQLTDGRLAAFSNPYHYWPSA